MLFAYMMVVLIGPTEERLGVLDKPMPSVPVALFILLKDTEDTRGGVITLPRNPNIDS